MPLQDHYSHFKSITESRSCFRLKPPIEMQSLILNGKSPFTLVLSSLILQLTVTLFVAVLPSLAVDSHLSQAAPIEASGAVVESATSRFWLLHCSNGFLPLEASI